MTKAFLFPPLVELFFPEWEAAMAAAIFAPSPHWSQLNAFFFVSIKSLNTDDSFENNFLLEVKISHNYRPQTKFAKVMFLQVSVCPRGGRACHMAPPPWLPCMPPWQPRMPPRQPRMPPGSHTPPGSHACPPPRQPCTPRQPHTPPRQPCTPPSSHTCPPPDMHAPPGNHACPPGNHACPPQIQEIYIFTAETHFLHLF